MVLGTRVKAQPQLTLGEICQALKEKESIQVSEPTMCPVLKHLNLTRKKNSLHPENKESERVQGLRREHS